MDLYLVSKKSQDESNTGIVEVAETIVYGVYTSSSRATAIADKYDATVTAIVADKESVATVSRWINPGFAS